jgi:hypothetical protein
MDLIPYPGATANSGATADANNVVPFARPPLIIAPSPTFKAPDQPLTYESLRHLFDNYRDLVPVRHWLEINGLLRRLKRGELATVEDRRLVRDLRAHIARAAAK